MKISGRNKIKGSVTKVTPGDVMAEVEIATAGGDKIVGLISRTSQEDLDIKVGDEITALIKATSVMFMKD